MSELRKNNETEDVHFSFGGDVAEVGAHKLVLASKSDVFKAQFYGAMKETKDPIDIHDSSTQAFIVFLDILYGNEVDIGALKFAQIAEIYFLAKKYLVEGLEKMIVEEVKSIPVTRNNIVEILEVVEKSPHLLNLTDTLLEISEGFMAKLDFPALSSLLCDNVKDVHLFMMVMNRARDHPSSPREEAQGCPNCKQTPCLNGRLLTDDNFVSDAEIKMGDQVYRTIRKGPWNGRNRSFFYSYMTNRGWWSPVNGTLKSTLIPNLQFKFYCKPSRR